ncbi:TonB-dependent receptor [Vibrio sp. HN007]|uniref:TonB-dependent receptor n=1 Tax=Vibrio iocasae TaxID=3098914 RepID=UPI0035D4E471
MRKSSIAIAVASLLSYTSFSYAQNSASDEETIVVFGRSENVNSVSDIASNIVVIGQEEIKASGATSLSSLLRSRAGIQISDSNSGPTIAMRGFSGSQAAHNTLILVDGRKLNKPDLSAPQLSSIPLNQIESIEVVSGSSGVLHGDQAVGGIINIITKKGGEVTELNASLGSNSAYGGGINLSRQISDTWSYSLSVSQDSDENYRDHNDRDTAMLLARIDYAEQDEAFYTEFSYYDNYRQYAGSLSKTKFEENPKQVNPANANDYAHEITKAARLGYKRDINKDWLAKADLSFDDTSINSIGWGSKREIDSIQQAVQLQAERALSVDAGRGNLLVGLDIGHSDYDASTRKNKQLMSSLYSQINYPVSNSVTLIGGGRYSKVEDDIKDSSTYAGGATLKEDATALELGANIKPNDNTRYYVRAESNFRFAKVDEQAYTSPGVAGLKPQTGVSIETGVDYIWDDYSVKFDIYNLKLEDEIVFDSSAEKPVGGNFSGANVNSDPTERFGGTFYFDAYVTEELMLGAEYSYVNAEYSKGDNKGNDIPWVASHSGRSFANYDLTFNWKLFAEAVYVGEKYENGDSGNVNDKLDAYWLGNLALSYINESFQANLRVDNIADEKYADFVSYSSFGSGYYVGHGREVNLSVSYSF